MSFEGLDRKSLVAGAAIAAAVLIIVFIVYLAAFTGRPAKEATTVTPPKSAPASSPTPASDAEQSLAAFSVKLSPEEFKQFKVEPVMTREFTVQRETIGTIDFNQEMSVQVFTPFPGKIREVSVKAGEDVKKGAMLFSVDSPDLVQTESALISAAGTQRLTTRALERAKQLYTIQGISQKDLDQTTSDQQAAEAALKAARDALRIFGKSDEEMDRIIADRKVDSVLVVRSPIGGRVTARNAAPGLFVQPGTAPAPVTVSDISTMWMLANVVEPDIPLMHLGATLDIKVNAYPDRLFHGKIVNIGAAVDPITHRILVRSEVRDPKHELRPGMFATYLIRTGKSMRSPAVPYGAVVREADGTMTVWAATERLRMIKLVVRVGLQQDGYWQILDGLKPGEKIATEGALFLDNALTQVSR